MKLLKLPGILGAVILVASAAFAQTNVANTAAQPEREGQVVTTESPAATDSGNTSTVNNRPDRTERKNLPPEVIALIHNFKEARERYLARQEALKKKLEGATDKERDAVREQIKELRAQWEELAKEKRKEFKERQAELADKLSEYRELLNEVRATAVTDGGGRTRRGED
jgi:DNA repair exonuclease SbcCD ATPase subunit